MINNFDLLKTRVIDAISSTDMEIFSGAIDSIEGNTIISSVGGSTVAAEYLKKILEKRNILCTTINPDDINHININNYKNIVVVSYGGKNYGVKCCLDNNLNKYVYSSKSIKDTTPIAFTTTIEREKSFIAIADTLIQLGLLLCYYLQDKEEAIRIISDMFDKCELDDIYNEVYEIFYNYSTTAVKNYLECTLTESGMAVPVTHDLYSYCHGRSTLQKNINSTMIFLPSNKTDLENVIVEALEEIKKPIIFFRDYTDDEIVNEFYKVLQAMFLTKQMAQARDVNLNEIKYSQIVHKLYYFKGSM